MKKVNFYLFVIFICSGCTSTSVVLDGCKNDIFLDRLEILDQETIEKNSYQQVSVNHLTLFYPRVVKLNKVILENELKCSDLKKVELEIEERFGLFNKIILRF